MNVGVIARSYTKLPVALLAAGVIAATPVVAPPMYHAVPALSTVAVQPASVITDVLSDLANLVDTGIGAVEISVRAVDGLPSWGIAGIVASLEHPNVTPNVLSLITQTYLNPASGGYLSQLLVEAVQLAKMLPYPLGPNSTNTELGILQDAIYGTIVTVGKLFNGFPSVLPALPPINAFIASAPGQLVTAVTDVIPAAVEAVGEAVSWAAHLPAVLEGSLESAIRQPGQIPGLVSNVINGVLGPNGLVSSLALTIARPLFHLPGIGSQIQQFVTQVVNDVTDFVSGLLPTPVQPMPFAAAKPAPSASVAAPAAASVGQPTDPPVRQRRQHQPNRVGVQAGAGGPEAVTGAAVRERTHLHAQPAASGAKAGRVGHGNRDGHRQHRQR